MVWRIVLWVFWQAVPAALAWSIASANWRLPLALGAACVGGGVYMLYQAWRGFQVLRWLRAGASGDIDLVGDDPWAEVAERVRKMVRSQARERAESAHRLHDILAALQASPNGVVLLDAQGRIEWFNQTAAEHFGFDIERDLLQHVSNLVRDPVFTTYYAAKDFHHDMQMHGRADSATKPVQLSVHLHPYGQGRSLLLSHDITAKEQAEAMRRDFVANVSHEIRTPLTVLSGFVETLQSLPLRADEHAHYLHLMAEQAKRMQTLVDDLLILSRLEGSPPPATSQWTAVPGLMAQCEQEAAALSQVLWGQSQRLQFSMSESSEIAGAGVELQSAMSNLVGNAVRYSLADQAIEVSWQVLPDGSGLFAVQDHGVGIAPEHIGRLTERFYRVERSRSRETGGTGLGLAIVKHVAQRHGAELQIESVLGKGSRFAMRFPPSRVRSMEAQTLEQQASESLI